MITRIPLGMEERESRPLVVEAEESEFAAKAAMVALPGHLHAFQVLVQFLLGGKGRPVDARKHGVVALAPPVGPRHRQQPYRPYTPGVGHMRAPAQVEKLTLPVDADNRLFRQIADQFQLVWLAGEQRERLFFADFAPFKGEELRPAAAVSHR